MSRGRCAALRLRHLLEARPNIPVILTTGYTAGMDAEKAWQLGSCTLLLKPFSLETFAEAVQEALRSSALATELP